MFPLDMFSLWFVKWGQDILEKTNNDKEYYFSNVYDDRTLYTILESMIANGEDMVEETYSKPSEVQNDVTISYDLLPVSDFISDSSTEATVDFTSFKSPENQLVVSSASSIPNDKCCLKRAVEVTSKHNLKLSPKRSMHVNFELEKPKMLPIIQYIEHNPLSLNSCAPSKSSDKHKNESTKFDQSETADIFEQSACSVLGPFSP